MVPVTGSGQFHAVTGISICPRTSGAEMDAERLNTMPVFGPLDTLGALGGGGTRSARPPRN